MWIFPANSSARGRFSPPLSTATISGWTIDYKANSIPAWLCEVITEIIIQTINTRTAWHQQALGSLPVASCKDIDNYLNSYKTFNEQPILVPWKNANGHHPLCTGFNILSGAQPPP